MYYSYYLNEKMLLESWQEHKEANSLLLLLLAKDNTRTIIEKMDYYLTNRNEINYDEEDRICHIHRLDEDEDFQEDLMYYQERKFMEEEAWECPDEIAYVSAYEGKYGHSSEMEWYMYVKDSDNRLFSKIDRLSNSKKKFPLREIDKVEIYQSDLDVIIQAKKKHKLTELETQVLFGLIFLCRAEETDTQNLNPEFRQKQFNALFDKSVGRKQIDRVISTDIFYEDFLSGNLIYREFNTKDEVAFTFITTDENNKLNISQVSKDALNLKTKYCSICGEVFEPNSNRQKMCEKCKAKVVREQTKLRMQKHRKKTGK